MSQFRMKSNNKGFSLVELMVVSALLIIVMGSSGFQMVEMNKMMKRMDNKQELLALASDLQNITSAQGSCTTALVANQNFDPSLAQSPSRIADGSFNPDPAQGLEFQLKLSSGENLVSGSKDLLKSYNLKVNSLKLYNAFSVGNFGPNQIWRVALVGHFSGQVGALEQVLSPRTIGSFFIKTDPNNKIVDCFNIDPNDPASFSQFTQAICEDLGGQFISGRCKGLGVADIGLCSNGKVLQGLNPNGSKRCIAVAAQSTTTITNNSGGKTCDYYYRSADRLFNANIRSKSIGRFGNWIPRVAQSGEIVVMGYGDPNGPLCGNGVVLRMGPCTATRTQCVNGRWKNL